VLNDWPDYNDPKADVTVTIKRTDLTRVLAKQVSFADALKTGLVSFTGNPAKLGELLGCLADLSQSFWFNIVTP
jgi:alkyl sulfatase BDS1-like metallo-beta-lactamase superfamily hydrolase